MQRLNKVPVVTAYFWIIKVLSTTVGETGADYLIFKLKWGLLNTSYLFGSLLLIFLAWHVSLRRYVPAYYWLTVVLVSIVGTLVTDNMTDYLHIPLLFSTTGFFVALILVFTSWYRWERTLSIQSVRSVRQELFYWTAILVTFALGTAVGDLLAEEWRLGYRLSGIIFLALLGFVLALHYLVKVNAVLTFWLAYVLTRPLGASIGDYLSHSVRKGGLGLGTSFTSEIFLTAIVTLVIYLSVSRRDVYVGDNTFDRPHG